MNLLHGETFTGQTPRFPIELSTPLEPGACPENLSAPGEATKKALALFFTASQGGVLQLAARRGR